MVPFSGFAAQGFPDQKKAEFIRVEWLASEEDGYHVLVVTLVPPDLSQQGRLLAGPPSWC